MATDLGLIRAFGLPFRIQFFSSSIFAFKVKSRAALQCTVTQLFCSFKLPMATAFTSIRGEASISLLNFSRSLPFSLLFSFSLHRLRYHNLLPIFPASSDTNLFCFPPISPFLYSGAAGFAASYMWSSICFPHQAQESAQFLDPFAGF